MVEEFIPIKEVRVVNEDLRVVLEVKVTIFISVKDRELISDIVFTNYHMIPCQHAPMAENSLHCNCETVQVDCSSVVEIEHSEAHLDLLILIAVDDAIHKSRELGNGCALRDLLMKPCPDQSTIEKNLSDKYLL